LGGGFLRNQHSNALPITNSASDVKTPHCT
jgi:hypothetical protein